MFRSAVLALLIALVTSGCIESSGSEVGACPYGSPILSSDPNTLLHGIACEKNEQCRYGACINNAMQQAGDTSYKVCTKHCSCGGPTSQCSNDNDPSKGLEFTCIKAAQGPGSECALKCTNDAFCQNVNPKQPFCVTGVTGVFTAGAVKVCSAKKG